MSLELSLYTIESDLADLIEMREQTVSELDGCLFPELKPEISAELETIDAQIREYITAEIRKVDNIRSFWRHAELMRDAAKAEAQVQAERARAWDERLKRLKAVVQHVMESIPFPPGKPKKLEGRRGPWTNRKSCWINWHWSTDWRSGEPHATEIRRRRTFRTYSAQEKTMSLELSLYTIESDLADLIEMREQTVSELDGCLFPELKPEISAELETIDAQIREYITAEIRKVDNIRSFWRHAELMRDAAKAEAQVQAERARAWDERLKRLKAVVQHVMESIPFPPGKPKKLEGRTGLLMLKTNGGKQAVEISNADLIPEEYQRYSVEMSGEVWEEITKYFGPSWVKEKMGRVSRAPSLALIAAELEKRCDDCEGRGKPRDPVFGEHISPDTCSSCNGTGKRSVAGCRLTERGAHVEVK